MRLSEGDDIEYWIHTFMDIYYVRSEEWKYRVVISSSKVILIAVCTLLLVRDEIPSSSIVGCQTTLMQFKTPFSINEISNFHSTPPPPPLLQLLPTPANCFHQHFHLCLSAHLIRMKSPTWYLFKYLEVAPECYVVANWQDYKGTDRRVVFPLCCWLSIVIQVTRFSLLIV